MAVATAPHPAPAAEQQHPGLAPGMMGMYIFLTSEVMFFGSLFATYFYLLGSQQWPPPGTVEHAVKWWPIPAINTVILLSSGVTCHFALDAITKNNRRRFISLLVVTIILGVLFELGQGYEFYNAYVREGFTLEFNQFASAFFTMTGFHGLHVLGGLVILALVLGRALRGQFSAQHHVGVAAATLYWHFVDVVWVFLFGILYLAVTFGR
jgi:cytochrome c oxidase subunit 3